MTLCHLLHPSRHTAGRGRSHRLRTGIGSALGLALVTALLVVAGPGPAGAAVPPYAAACSALQETNPVGDGYALPIENQITDGTLTQGNSTITDIDASVCGLLQFPSLSADIPASNIQYGVATANLAGLAIGTADITASGPSTATTSRTPAPDGGLVFTLTAETANVINVSVSALGLTLTAISCDASLSATLNTDPSDGGTALTGSLATGAQGTAYAPAGEVTVSSFSANDAGNVAETTLCPVVGDTIGLTAPENMTATFKAPLSFTSTLTQF